MTLTALILLGSCHHVRHVRVQDETADREARDCLRSKTSTWWRLIGFFAPVLIMSVSIGISASIAGTFVLLRREALIATALPQAVAVGAAAGMRLGWPTLPPAIVALGANVLLLALEQRHGITRRAPLTLAPAMYVSALCLSFLLIAHAGQHVQDLQNHFTGIDVAVTPLRAMIATPILLILALLCAWRWRRWLLLAQSPATAELAGISVARSNALFLTLLALIVLIGTDSRGVVMVLAMLFLPPAIVAPWPKRIPNALLLASIVSVVCLAIGFILSVTQSWPLSHSSGGVGLGLLAVSHAAKALVRR